MLDYNFLKNPYPDNADPVSGEYAPQSLQEYNLEQEQIKALKQDSKLSKSMFQIFKSMLK